MLILFIEFQLVETDSIRDKILEGIPLQRLVLFCFEHFFFCLKSIFSKMLYIKFELL